MREPRTIARIECDAGNQAACRSLGQNSSTASFEMLRPMFTGTLADLQFILAMLRPRKVSAHESYAGMVYMKYRSGDSYRISVPLAGASFNFDFEPTAPTGSEPE